MRLLHPNPRAVHSVVLVKYALGHPLCHSLYQICWFSLDNALDVAAGSEATIMCMTGDLKISTQARQTDQTSMHFLMTYLYTAA